MLAFFSRLPRCVVGMEACATAHYWARELSALGHEVRLMPAQYVKAYIKRNKNDAADAEAICEAVSRPTMRFVPAKTAEQQAAVLLHQGRERLVRQRTMLVNDVRGHLAEFGVIAPQGLRKCGLQLRQVLGPGPASTFRLLSGGGPAAVLALHILRRSGAASVMRAAIPSAAGRPRPARGRNFAAGHSPW